VNKIIQSFTDETARKKKSKREEQKKGEVQEQFDKILLDLQKRYFPTLSSENSDNFVTPLSKKCQKSKYQFMGNENYAGNIITRSIEKGFAVYGVHFFPDEDEHERMPENLQMHPALKLNPSFVQIRKEVDVFVFIQNAKKVAEILNHLLTLRNNYFETKGTIFLVGDAEDLLWKIISKILLQFNILHLAICEKGGIHYVSGNPQFYNQMIVFLTQTVTSIENLTYIGKGNME
jgi:hypothetical protein